MRFPQFYLFVRKKINIFYNLLYINVEKKGKIFYDETLLS
jgi:hypothetical protein